MDEFGSSQKSLAKSELIVNKAKGLLDNDNDYKAEFQDNQFWKIENQNYDLDDLLKDMVEDGTAPK